MGDLVLRVEDLYKTFRVKLFKKILALNGLNMSLKRGDIYGFVGENGAGKTTLMRILAGRVFADEGDVELFGHKGSDEYIKQLAKIGVLI